MSRDALLDHHPRVPELLVTLAGDAGLGEAEELTNGESDQDAERGLPNGDRHQEPVGAPQSLSSASSTHPPVR
jgi:hypothetical protein